MKKVFTLSLMSLLVSVSVVAQSEVKPISEKTKSEAVIKPIIKVDKLKMKPIKLENARINNATQPVKREEEVKSIETNQK